MEYTYKTLTLEQALRVTRFLTTHVTDVTRCRAVVEVAGVTFDRDYSTSTMKAYEGFYKMFTEALKAVGRKGTLLLQISKNDGEKEFHFYEK